MKIHFLGLVPGNHDRGLDTAAMPLFPDGYCLEGAWHIVHGDQPIEHSHTVMGHWHPAIRQHRRKLPCFLARDHHLILPAFSLDAAGVDVGKESRWSDWDCYVVEEGKVDMLT